MRSRSGYLLFLPIMIVLLSGCFQQAGEVFQPVDLTPAGGGSNTSGPSRTPGILSGPETPTLPVVITMVSPTRSAPSTTTPLPLDESTPIPIDGTQATATTSTEFVTPISPLGPVTPIAPISASPSALPSTTPSGLITPTALSEGGASVDGCSYTVRSGDTLYRIAIQNDLTLAALREANPDVTGDLIQPGQVLRLPECEGQSAGEPVTAVTSAPVPTDLPVAGPAAGSSTYTVRPGDTLFSIAQRFRVTVQAIQDANELLNPNRLSVGQELIIPPPSG